MSFQTFGQKSRQGFTLVELLIVIAIVIVLLALLLPTVGNVMATRRQTECANHLRQIGAALELARADGAAIRSRSTDGNTLWTTEVLPRLGDDTSLLFCAEDVPGDRSSSYAMNTRAYRLSDMDGGRIVALDYKKVEAEIVVDHVDKQDWSHDGGQYAARHLQGINVLLHTGGVRVYEPEDIDPRVCHLWKQYWRPAQDHSIQLQGCLEADSNVLSNVTKTPLPDREPDYDNSDLAKCDQELIILDNESDGVTISYDETYDFTELADWLADLYRQQGLPVPMVHANFRPSTTLPDGADGDPYHRYHMQAEGHQSSGGTNVVYEFDVDPGKYRVAAHWVGHSSYSDATPIELADGDSVLRRFNVNQELSSGQSAVADNEQPLEGPEDPTIAWYPLGEHDVQSGKLKVTISAAAGAPDHDAGEQHLVVADAIRVECADARAFYADRCYGQAPPPMDDADAIVTPGWQPDDSAEAYNGSQAWIVPGVGNETVTFEFSDVTPGVYQLWTHFTPKQGQATNAPFTLHDGNTVHTVQLVDQSRSYLGTDLDGDGRRWYKVGQYEIQRRNGVSLVISDNADGNVVVDAIRIRCSFRDTGESYEDCDNTSDIYGRECRKHYAEDYGADEETEEAVAEAFNWLSRHQYEGGYWSFDHTGATCPYISEPEPCNNECGGKGSGSSYHVAATAMALMPFLGAGFGPEHETYGQVVTEGINFLMDNVGPNGELHSRSGNYGGFGYEVGIGSWAMAEALGICRAYGFGEVDESMLTQKSIASIQYLANTQNAEGGWRYFEATDEDMTVSGWVVNALTAASSAGITYQTRHPEGTIPKTRQFLTRMSHDWTIIDDPAGTYAYEYYYGSKWGTGQSVYYDAYGGATHVARLLRMLTGASANSAGMQEAANQELERIADGMPKEAYKNYYAHHFMRKMDDDKWTQWDEEMKKYLLEDNPQPKTGHVRGSWSIGGSTLVAPNCGRLWDTVSGSLCLEVYYRYAKGI